MDRRRHYLEIAFELFTAHGFHGVSIDQIVSAAGGSKATLYRYFSSKEELFEAIIVDLTEATVEDRSVDQLAALDLEEGLRTIGHATARAALSEQATVFFRLAAGELNRFPRLARVFFERGPAVSYERLREFLAAQVAAGELEIDDLQIAAEQFLGGIVGHQQLRRALGRQAAGRRGIDARVEAAITTLLAVYRPREGRPRPRGRRAQASERLR